MTTHLEQAIATVHSLPATQQDELADFLTAATHPQFEYSPEQQAKIEESIAQADAGQFVSDDQVEQIFVRYRTV